jgi:AraC-like DNA-binding protein/ligand-binding sensor protein
VQTFFGISEAAAPSPAPAVGAPSGPKLRRAARVAKGRTQPSGRRQVAGGRVAVLASRSNQRSLLEALQNSRIYQDYQRAFTEATGLMVTLRPVETWQLPFHGHNGEHTLCSLMSSKSRSCGVCLEVQQKLSELAQHEPQTVRCPVGLTDAAVPVRLGEQLIGFLQTGQILCKRPTPTQVERSLRMLRSWGIEEDADRLRALYEGTRVLTPRRFESVLKLLHIFAQHLSMVSNQLLVHQQHAEPPVIARAKAYILEHQGEDITLADVARAVNTSSFYFCKLFKKTTGINFTNYLSRVRIERAQNLLLNPSLRISEIGFEVGFQSLTHFNRVFKKIIGQSPTQFRAQLPT